MKDVLAGKSCLNIFYLSYILTTVFHFLRKDKVLICNKKLNFILALENRYVKSNLEQDFYLGGKI